MINKINQKGVSCANLYDWIRFQKYDEETIFEI